VAYSPDGSRIASASWDHTVKVWDARSGTEIATLRGHKAQVTSVAFSSDGSRIASASWDQTVKVWDARSGTEIATLRGHGAQVSSLAYSPDGSRIAGALTDSTVKLWDARSGVEIIALRGHTNLVTSVAYSPDGSRIASASWDGMVKVWEVRTGTEIATLRGHTGFVYSVAYSPDGSRIASASGDGTVKEWDARSGTEIATLRGHTSFVSSVAYSPDGSRLVSTDLSGKRMVWDAAGARLLPDERPPNRLPLSSVSPDGEHVAVPERAVVRIYRRHPVPGGYDPWLEDAERRRVQVPLWHDAGSAAAANRGDTFAADFHRRRLAEGDNLRLLAWARLAEGQHDACKQVLQRLRQEQHGLGGRWGLAADLAAGLSPQPTLGHAAASLAVPPVARREELRLAAVLVRAAALLPDNGIPRAELVSLARSCTLDDPQSWQSLELLGAALVRDGKPAVAVKVLDESVRLHGNGGSLWARLFLALAYQRLGHRDDAEVWHKKADKAGPWEEQVMQFQLLGELEAARKER
jgi:dipeptidyl aminopeptidase/acylaminoacyl peptidase